MQLLDGKLVGQLLGFLEVVDTDESVLLLRFHHDALHDGVAEILVELQTHLRQLHRNLRLQSPCDHLAHDAKVFFPSRFRTFARLGELAENIDGREVAVSVERFDRAHHVVDRLAGNVRA